MATLPRAGKAAKHTEIKSNGTGALSPRPPYVAASASFEVELKPALKRLDALIERAVEVAHNLRGPSVAGDPFRGLHIGPDDVLEALAQEPMDPPAWSSLLGDGDAGPPSPYLEGESYRLDTLRAAFGLTVFDMDVVLLALAPEVDLRYERLFAFLQDDVSRRRPSVDLALNLLRAPGVSRSALRERLSPGSPLLSSDIVHLVADPNHNRPTLLSHYLKLDEQIVGHLLGGHVGEGVWHTHNTSHVDERIAHFCRRIVPPAAPDGPRNSYLPDGWEGITAQAREAVAGGPPMRLLFYGPDEDRKRRAAGTLAAELGVPLVAISLRDMMPGLTEFETRAPQVSAGEGPGLSNLLSLARLALREAYFSGALALVEVADASLAALGATGAEMLIDTIGAQPTPPLLVLISETAHSLPRGRSPQAAPICLPFAAPDWRFRAGMWREALGESGLSMGTEDVEQLAGRFNLSRGQIERAVASAQGYRRWWGLVQAEDQEQPQETLLDALFSAARAQTGRDLDALTTRIEPVYGWDDLVLPPDELSQLREVCSRAARNPYVLDTWGFGRKLSGGKGVSVLFAGPSGTGKTMAAEVIAGELRLGLYKIDLAGVVSKYIGETEKNLDRIFRAAEATSAILFFDEADALFGKRSEVRDSHDRYANIEISYLLQKMEAYEGVTILATNLRGNLDEAFTRRLTFAIHFPFPDEAARLRIWQGIWPLEAPLDPGLDLAPLARAFKLSGGSIKNVALAASFLAADAGDRLAMPYLLHALRREYGKMGKLVSEEELESVLVEAGI